MALSKRSIDTLTDLIEIKLSCIQVYDREDARELAVLEQARRELQNLSGDPQSSVLAFADAAPRRGRRAAAKATAAVG